MPSETASQRTNGWKIRWRIPDGPEDVYFMCFCTITETLRQLFWRQCYIWLFKKRHHHPSAVIERFLLSIHRPKMLSDPHKSPFKSEEQICSSLTLTNWPLWSSGKDLFILFTLLTDSRTMLLRAAVRLPLRSNVSRSIFEGTFIFRISTDGGTLKCHQNIWFKHGNTRALFTSLAQHEAVALETAFPCSTSPHLLQHWSEEDCSVSGTALLFHYEEY